MHYYKYNVPSITPTAQTLIDTADQHLLSLGFQKVVEKTKTVYKYTYTQTIELGVAPEIIELQPFSVEEKALLKKYEVKVHGLDDFAFMRFEVQNIHQRTGFFLIEINHFKTDLGRICYSISQVTPTDKIEGSTQLIDEMYAWEFRTMRPLTLTFSPSVLGEFIGKFPAILAQTITFYDRMKPYYIASELDYIAFNRNKIANNRKYRITLQTIVDALKANPPDISED